MNEDDRRLARFQNFVGGRSLPRERIGRYRLLELLGEGGAGVVFRARDEELGRDVALKMLKTAQSFSETQVERFLREARTAARLRHPGIATVHETGRDQDVLYYTMELVPGRPFDPRRGTLPERVALLSKVARAIHYAHENGILHRDLKPGNILVDDQGQPRVLDFGLSRDAAAPGSLTQTGAVFGTPAYMAPEQAEGRDVAATADVYALGTLLYESLTGHVPFDGDSLRQILNRLLTEEPPPPQGPPDLAAIALKSLEKNPARRYASAGEFADDLDRYLSGKPTIARPPSLAGKFCRHVARRWKAVLLLAIISSLCLLLYKVSRGDLGETVEASVESPSGPSRLRSGDGLKAAERTTVTYEDGSRLLLSPGSSVRQGRGHIGMPFSRVSRHVTLLTGVYAITVTAQTPKEPMAVSTYHAAVYLQQGYYAVEVTPSWTRVEAQSGLARVAALHGGPVAIAGAGQIAVLESGKDILVRKPEDGLIRGDQPGACDDLTLGLTAMMVLPPSAPADELLLQLGKGIGEDGIAVSRTRNGALRYEAVGVRDVEIPGVFVPDQVQRISVVHHPGGGVFVARNGVALGSAFVSLPSRPASRSRMTAAPALKEFRVYRRALSDAECARIDQDLAGRYGGAASEAGWSATYFNGTSLSSPVLTRRDAEINFDWGPESPDLSIDADRFSARWTGRLIAPHTEPTTFHVTADDGVRLWVGGKLVIDSWVDQVPTEFSATVPLVAGTRVELRLEYYEQASSAQVRLFWSGPSTPKSCIPAGCMER